MKIILADTRHAGNIGAVARLMKNLGLTRLALVNPTRRGHIEAVRMAVGAEEILEGAEFFDQFEEAIADCAATFAVTRRSRRMSKEVYDPVEAAAHLPTQAGTIGVAFGSEKLGLSNEQVALCTGVITLKVSKEHSSYNLAQAAAIVLYTLRAPHLSIPKQSRKGRADPATTKERRLLYRRMETAARSAGFFGRTNDAKVMAAIENIYERAGLNKKEVAILQGVFRALGKPKR